MRGNVPQIILNLLTKHLGKFVSHANFAPCDSQITLLSHEHDVKETLLTRKQFLMYSFNI